jgi:hypothetical protein
MSDTNTATPTNGTDPQATMRFTWVDIEKLELLIDDEGETVNLGGEVGDTTPIQVSLREDTTLEKTGLVQPLEITEQGPNGMYRIKDGARRVTAMRQVISEWNTKRNLLKKKGYEKNKEEIDILVGKIGILRRVPAIITGAYDDVDAIVDRQVAQFTTKRRDPITMAHALQQLRRNHNWTVGRMSIRLGMSQDKVQTILRTLDAPESVQARLKNGQMSLTTYDRFLEGKTSEAQEEIVAKFAPDEDVTGEKVRKNVRAKTDERQAQTKLPFMADLTVMPDLNVALAKVQAATGKFNSWTDSTRISAYEVLLTIQREVQDAIASLRMVPTEDGIEGEQQQMIGGTDEE